jgi:hypothetical protein
MPTIPTTMHAAAEFGGPEVLRLRRLPVPAQAAAEVLIRIDTAGCNPASCVRGFYESKTILIANRISARDDRPMFDRVKQSRMLVP